jgi:acyl-coenzyme A thioesterase PaaI-like protein
VVCNPAHPIGLGQDFQLQSDGSVQSTFTGREVFEGYPGLLHGGVTAALLDGAMTNCLFARGIEALTAELKVRYREPVVAAGEVTMRAWLVETYDRLHFMRAELRQDGRVKATAQGKFMTNHE